MDEDLRNLLVDIFGHLPPVTDKTIAVRMDKVGDQKFHWVNGVDVRVSIDQLRLIQESIANASKNI